MRRKTWTMLASVVLACGGETPIEIEGPPPGPRWVNVSGTFHAEFINGEPVPAIIGVRECSDGTFTDVRLGPASLTLLDESTDPTVAERVEGFYFINYGACGNIGSDSRWYPRATYRAREDSVFFSAGGGLFPKSGGWTSARRTQFRALIQYEGVVHVIVFTQ